MGQDAGGVDDRPEDVAIQLYDSLYQQDTGLALDYLCGSNTIYFETWEF